MQRALADIPSARIKPLVRDILHIKTKPTDTRQFGVVDLRLTVGLRKTAAV